MLNVYLYLCIYIFCLYIKSMSLKDFFYKISGLHN